MVTAEVVHAGEKLESQEAASRPGAAQVGGLVLFAL